MPVLTAAQIGTLQRVLAGANHVLPKVEFLEALGNINPQLAVRTREIRSQRDYLVQLATAMLEMERALGGQVTIPPPPPPSALMYTSPPTTYSPPPYSPPPTGGNQLPPAVDNRYRTSWPNEPTPAQRDQAQRLGYYFEKDEFQRWWRVPMEGWSG